MNPQQSPWMKIADHLTQDSIKRDLQQKQLQRIAKINYQKQLRNQIQLQRSLKKKAQQQQRQYDRILIRKSMQDQQKIYQIQQQKIRASNQKQMRLDLENQYYLKERQYKQKLLKDIQKDYQMKANQQNQIKIKILKEKQQQKKENLLHVLKDTIQYKSNYKKIQKEEEIQFDKYKMSEQQLQNQKREHQRHQFLLDLKKRAETIDYGSHNAVQRANNHSLVQRKRQEWNAYRQNIQYQEKLKEFQRNDKVRRLTLQRHYRDQLKNQIHYNQESKHLRDKIELENDKIQSFKSQQMALSYEQYKKQIQRQKQKILNEQLSHQIQQKHTAKKVQPYAMQDKQFKFNLGILRGSSSIIPGQTYNLDPSRKRQLQTVAKSMGTSIGNSPSLGSSRNYLAEKGLSIFQK